MTISHDSQANLATYIHMDLEVPTVHLDKPFITSIEMFCGVHLLLYDYYIPLKQITY